MKIEQLAVQMYTVRSLLDSPEEIRKTLERIRDIGYPAVQISGLSYDLIAEEDVAALCKEIGLTICATHEPPNMILYRPDAVIERLDKLGCNATAYPFPAGIDFGSEDSVSDLLQRLEAAGQTLSKAGKILCYHNHHQEFRKLDGRIILERIYEDLPAEAIQGELDTYWVQFGGGDSERWVKKLAGRTPLLHLKDYKINDDNQVEFCEVGNGVLDFPAIIKAADEGGCEWFIVEQDTCPGDPVDSLKQSFDYLKTLCD